MILSIPIIGQIRITRIKKKTAWERCDARGIGRDYEEKRKRVMEQLKRERGE